MKRSNKLLAFLLALTLVFSLSACGDNTSGSTEETETTAQSETSETSAAVCDSEDKAGIEGMDLFRHSGCLDNGNCHGGYKCRTA